MRLARLATIIGLIIIAAALLSTPLPAHPQRADRALDLGPAFTNSIGMRLARIEPGMFLMGSEDGDRDEQPVHQVAISRPFYLGTYEVTNAEYEQFDPGHRALRGKLEYSKEDDEAVVFVTWHDAVGFARWLSDKEGRPYRLPAEAEWEYAARAGTTTRYSTGDDLPTNMQKNARVSSYPDSTSPEDIVPLTVGLVPPNPWGLFDVHGNVEEWTLDWYGPYVRSGQVDPVGRAEGEFKITRGGSHSTVPFYLRAANRMATLPDDRHWLIGFRLLLGDLPDTDPLPVAPPTALHQHGVDPAVPPDRHQGPDPAAPYFAGPRLYMKLEPAERGPFYDYNWMPALTEMPNGDLLAVWGTGLAGSRVGAQAASRLRHGRDAWEPASIFWDVPDRRDHGVALWWDGDNTVYHAAGLSAAATYSNVATILRTSTDSGRSWSKARIIVEEHGPNNMGHVLSRWPDGTLVFPADQTDPDSTILRLSRDGGLTWVRSEGSAAGIHAPVVKLRDGRLLALGRTDGRGRMPRSVSTDDGRTWTVTDSEFPPIASAQRPVLLRLASGDLFFASFADSMVFTDDRGNDYLGSGLFGALSMDDGDTWPVQRLIVPGGPPQWLPHHRFRDSGFTVSDQTAEPRAYLAATQAENGVIHLITGAYHYAFNAAWLMTPPPTPALGSIPTKDRLPVVVGGTDPDIGLAWPGRMRFVGQGVRETDVVTAGTAGAVRIQVPAGRRVAWRDDGRDGFGAARADVGVTVEITARFVAGSSRALNVTAHVGNGRTYSINLLPSAVLVDDMYAYVRIPRVLDNITAAHRFRMAISANGLMRVYRDGELLAVRSPFVDGDQADGPSLTVGTRPDFDGVIQEISYDLTGAYAPPGGK